MTKIRTMVVACILLLPLLAQAKRAAPPPLAIPTIVQVAQIDLPNKTISLMGNQTMTVQEARTVTKIVDGRQVVETVVVAVAKNVPVVTTYRIDEFKIVSAEGKDLGDKAWEKLALKQLLLKCDAMPDATVSKLFAPDILLLLKK